MMKRLSVGNVICMNIANKRCRWLRCVIQFVDVDAICVPNREVASFLGATEALRRHDPF